MHEGKVSALAVSMVTVGQNTGIFIGPILFGRVMESSGGWTLAYTMYVPIAFLRHRCGAPAERAPQDRVSTTLGG